MSLREPEEDGWALGMILRYGCTTSITRPLRGHGPGSVSIAVQCMLGVPARGAGRNVSVPPESPGASHEVDPGATYALTPAPRRLRGSLLEQRTS